MSKIKTQLKNMLVPALASRPLSTLMEPFFCHGASVFMFHRFLCRDTDVNGHDPDFLHECLHYLKRNAYHFISIETLIDAINSGTRLPPRSVAFTMDDGFLDQATVAAPVFIEHNCPVTIFLIAGLLDGELWPWDDQVSYLVSHCSKQSLTVDINRQPHTFKISNQAERRHCIHSLQNLFKTQPGEQIDTLIQALSTACSVALPTQAPRNYQPMQWQQARQLEQAGVQFGPHTRTHRILSRLDDESCRHEIEHSWQRLQQELSKPCPVFCYPTGRHIDFGKREAENIAQAGLKGAVSTEPTFCRFPPPSDKQATGYQYRIPRFAFPDNFNDFAQYTSWIERAKTQLRGG